MSKTIPTIDEVDHCIRSLEVSLMYEEQREMAREAVSALSELSWWEYPLLAVFGLVVLSLLAAVGALIWGAM